MIRPLTYMKDGKLHLDESDRLKLSNIKYSVYDINSCTQHYYKFNEDLYSDSSGYNRNLVSTGYNPFSYEENTYVSGSGCLGKNIVNPGSATIVTGLTWNVGAPFTGSNTPGNDRTISFWIYVVSYPSDFHIITLQNKINVLVGSPTSSVGYANYHNIQLSNSGIYNDFAGVGSSFAAIGLNSWKNVVCRLSGGVNSILCDIWVNGVFQDSGSMGPSTTARTEDTLKFHDTSSSNFIGYFDELIIENCYWTNDYILEYYNAQKLASGL